MRHILFRILNTLSIALLILSVGLCIYSFIDGRILMRDASFSTFVVGQTDGWFFVFEDGEDPSVVSPDFYRLSSDRVSWQFESFSAEELRAVEGIMSPAALRLPGWAYYNADQLKGMRFKARMVVIHFAWPIALFSIPPTYWLFTRHRDPRRRARLGLCVKCGYDLRGSAGVCPECGSPVLTPASAPAAAAGSSHEGSACDD